MIRILVCLWVFGYGAYALGHGVLGFILAGLVAIWINAYWKEQSRQAAIRRHHENVVADEQLRMDVRARRRNEGRQP